MIWLPLLSYWLVGDKHYIYNELLELAGVKCNFDQLVLPETVLYTVSG